MEDHCQEELFKAMSMPGFYPHSVGRIEQKETHISMVFLTGDYVYKIKKPVDLGFLDFTSLAKRRRYCELEVALNRRLTHDVYLDVVGITTDGKHYSLNGTGPVVEFAVRMRQLPDAFSMVSLLDQNCVTDGQIEALAVMLADFYEKQKRVPTDSAAESWDNVRYACEENFRQTRGAVGSVLDSNLYQTVQSAIRFFLTRGKALFDSRSESGKIYDGHGDLRCGHIYYAGKNLIQVIDCIEFNKRLRNIDIASDLAFLTMDLDFRKAHTMGSMLLETYVRKTTDFQVYALLPFYKCYRAMVRCKVNFIRLKTNGRGGKDQGSRGSIAGRYLSLAHGYAGHFGRPTIWVIGGLPAAGKSTLARFLSNTMATTTLRSDVIRKELYGISPEKRSLAEFEQGLYRPESNRLTYDALLQQTGELIVQKQAIFLDATFSLPEQRRQVTRLAEAMNCRVVFVECTAPETLLRDRLLQRERGLSVSDARERHFDMLKHKYVPMDEVDPTLRLRVDTEQSVHDCVHGIMSWDYMSSLGSEAMAQWKGGCHVQNNSGGNRPGH